MWRAKPLAKVLLRMTVFGAVLGAALGLLSIIAFEPTVPAPKSFYQQQIILSAIKGGVILAMALYAAVVHRTIHKPLHFRFAMLIVATIVTLVVVQGPFHIAFIVEMGIPLWDWFTLAFESQVFAQVFLGAIAKHVFIGLMSLFVAGKYLREAYEQFMQSTGQTPA